MKLSNYRYRFFTALIISLLTIGSFLLVISFINAEYKDIWNGTDVLNQSIVCENPNKRDFLREKYNSGSTSSFIFSFVFPFCFFIADLKAKTKPTRLSNYPFLSFFFSFNYLLHFIGTFINHACSCEFGLQLDNMFLWISLPVPSLVTIIINTPKIKTITASKVYAVFLSIYVVNAIVSIILSLANLPVLGQTIITVFYLAIIIFTNIGYIIHSCRTKTATDHNKRMRTLFWVILVLILIGLALAALDKVLCNGTVGSHLGWHIDGGIDLTLLYIYHWSIE